MINSLKVFDRVKTLKNTMPISTGHIIIISRCGRYARVWKQFGSRVFINNYKTSELKKIKHLGVGCHSNLESF